MTTGTYDSPNDVLPLGYEEIDEIIDEINSVDNTLSKEIDTAFDNENKMSAQLFVDDDDDDLPSISDAVSDGLSEMLEVILNDVDSFACSEPTTPIITTNHTNYANIIHQVFIHIYIPYHTIHLIIL